MEQLYTTQQLAEFLGVNPVTLSRHRVNGIGIPWVRYGRSLIRYRQSDIEEYLQKHTEVPAGGAA